MWPNPLFPADLVTFTEEILNEKLHLLKKSLMENFIFCAVIQKRCFSFKDFFSNVNKWPSESIGTEAVKYI